MTKMSMSEVYNKRHSNTHSHFSTYSCLSLFLYVYVLVCVVAD